MTKVDLTKAPEGATHYDPSAQLEWERWMKFESANGLFGIITNGNRALAGLRKMERTVF